jgi:hypothetical protein
MCAILGVALLKGSYLLKFLSGQMLWNVLLIGTGLFSHYDVSTAINGMVSNALCHKDRRPPVCRSVDLNAAALILMFWLAVAIFSTKGGIIDVSMLSSCWSRRCCYEVHHDGVNNFHNTITINTPPTIDHSHAETMIHNL